jgi:hypothetical protein
MSNFTLQVTVQVDVQNAENIQQARESVFALLSAPKESKSRKGRPASGPKATVTGVQIPTHGGVTTRTRSLGTATADEINAERQELQRELREVTETSP